MKLEAINFTDINEAECNMILEWRNHPDIRNYMTNKNIITKDEHLAFLKSLESSAIDFFHNRIREAQTVGRIRPRREGFERGLIKKYFLVKQKDDYLGVVDFVDIDDTSCEFGLYVNPYIQKKGVGSLLLEEIIRYAFEELGLEKIRAKLYKENKKALGLYEKYGLRITREDSEYFYMELEDGK